MLSIEKFQDKAKTIADELEYACTFDPDKSYTTFFAYLEKEDQKITLINGQYGNVDRIVIWGDYPRPIDGQWHCGQSPSITVTEEKDAPAIAKDMRRRFLPEYLKGLATVLERNTERNAEIKRAKDSLEAVAEALGTKPFYTSGSSRSGDGRVCSNDENMGGLTADYRYNGDFKLELNLPLSRVLDLITHLKNPFLTTIVISSEDVEEYCQENGCSEEEASYLVDNLDGLIEQVVGYVQDTEWRRLFEEACSGYITGYRMQRNVGRGDS